MIKKFLIFQGLFFILIFTLLVSVLLLFSEEETEENLTFDSMHLAEEVLRWRPEVEFWANEYDISEWVSVLLAIMQTESGGRVPDLMQSSESAGLPVNTLEYEDSIAQGVRYLASIIRRAETLGLDDDQLAILQAYNFGIAYLNFLSNQNERHSLDISAIYSRTVVAPSLGNTTGIRAVYNHPVAIASGRPYRYLNGGNFHYAFIAMRYIMPTHFDDETVQALMNIALRYEGWPYLWGGSNPTMGGFDCSGLIQWVFMEALNIRLPRTANEQFHATTRISEEEARPGDLVFFQGTHPYASITHVGIYLGNGQMFDANNFGVMFSNIDAPYWQPFFVGFGRVLNFEE